MFKKIFCNHDWKIIDKTYKESPTKDLFLGKNIRQFKVDSVSSLLGTLVLTISCIHCGKIHHYVDKA